MNPLLDAVTLGRRLPGGRGGGAGGTRGGGGGRAGHGVSPGGLDPPTQARRNGETEVR